MSRSDSQGDRARDEKFRALCYLSAAAGLSATLLLFSGCSSSEGNGPTSQASGSTNHPPVVKAVSIMPSPVTLVAPLTVRVEAQDLDLNTLSFRYRWLVNGQILPGQAQESLQPGILKRGDKVEVEVTPFDGMIDGIPFRSAPASVVNTLPIISHVAVDFDHQAQGRQLLASVDVDDPDRDSVSLTYRWRKNDTVLKEGEENTLSIAGLTAKDTIQLDVTASDGTPDGTTTVTERFTLSNSSPTIVSKPPSSATVDQYEYLVKATDADGDPITYALETAPPGMTIEAKTGHIRWKVSPDMNGSYRIRVVAKDPQGGFAVQEFDLSLKDKGQS